VAYRSGALSMLIADLAQIAGRTYPAGRRTQNVVGGVSPIQATAFSLGHVTLEPNGGQVPWHNQEQEEIYFVLEGEGEMCLGEEKTALATGQAVCIPPVDEYRIHATAHDLLLRTSRRRGALAAGTGRDIAASRHRSSAAARGRETAALTRNEKLETRNERRETCIP
jgi:quercetin dioxygenase-like cupin family protein